jgi:hypothetical protein
MPKQGDQQDHQHRDPGTREGHGAALFNAGPYPRKAPP